MTLKADFRSTFALSRTRGEWTSTGLSSWWSGAGAGDDTAGWSFTDGQLTVKADRFGMIPLYVGIVDACFAVGRSAVAVARQLPNVTVDDDAMAVLLRLYGFCGTDTFFREVRRVAPGETITWQAGAVTRTDAAPSRTSITPDRTQAKALYRDLFHAAMQQQEHDDTPIVIPLSGGRDSRHILAEVARWKNREIVAVTVDMSLVNGSNDHEIALALCRQLDVRCEILHPDENAACAELEKLELVDAECIEHGWLLPLRKWLQKKGTVTVFDGLAGDTLSEAKFFNDERLRMMRSHDTEGMAVDALGNNTLLKRMLQPEQLQRWSYDRAIARLSTEIRRHCDAPNPLASFRLLNRTSRTVALAPHRILDTGCTVHTPYLYAPLASWLLSIEAEFFRQGGFHTETIAEGFPEVREVPFDVRSSVPASVRPRRSRYLRTAYQIYAKNEALPFRAPFTRLAFMRGFMETPFGGNSCGSVADMVLWFHAMPPQVRE